MRIFLALIVLLTKLAASLADKSAMVYYGSNLSYTMAGIHDYIITQPKSIDPYTPGFKLYKNKIYVYVSIGEIDKTLPQYEKIKKEWIKAYNKAWQSDILDITNKEYQKFLFERFIEPLRQKGVRNFFFDTLDSYQIYAKTPQERQKCENALADFINTFHKRYPKSKLVVNRGFEIIDKIHDSIEAVLFESYEQGLQGEKLQYKSVSKAGRKWLDIQIAHIKKYRKDIIVVDYLPPSQLKTDAMQLVNRLKARGLIPYVATKSLDIYGYSSKNALKREVLTIINETRLDRTLLEAHQYGATVLEYMGYKQVLYDISTNPLPCVKTLRRFAGVIIWLQDYYHDKKRFIKWLDTLQKSNIPFCFVGNFGIEPQKNDLALLDIIVTKKSKTRKAVIFKDPIIGYEIDPPLTAGASQIELNTTRAIPLLVYKNTDGTTSTPAALTVWGGYIVDEAFMLDVENENIWVADPFAFFKQALDLQPLIVPDPTTQNGSRLLFTHIDGDGFFSRVEGEQNRFAAEEIYEKILKVYKIPHSVSVIGAEVDPNGLYPQYANDAMRISKEIFALPNVEPATHTYTHTFFWGKITKDGDLDPKYRLKPKGYHFSLYNELKAPLEYINTHFLDPNSTKKAQTVFWSGDCAPRYNALSFVYQHDILNINGGDTTIIKTAPWLSRIAPYGLQRKGYTQVYTGQQNENVFTNDWLGPFWGFKRVTQTFDMTDSPRRFKPIDIYYHLYSGSKDASLKALRYVFNYALSQKRTFPIFTSEYIPKVQNLYEISIAKEKNKWLLSGMESLKTIRIDKAPFAPDLGKNPDIIGYMHHNDDLYIALDNDTNTSSYILDLTPNKNQKQNFPYIISANGYLEKRFSQGNETKLSLSGHVDQKVELSYDPACQTTFSTLPIVTEHNATYHRFTFPTNKIDISIRCPQ